MSGSQVSLPLGRLGEPSSFRGYSSKRWRIRRTEVLISRLSCCRMTHYTSKERFTMVNLALSFPYQLHLITKLKDGRKEKPARASLFTAMQRALGPNTIVIMDGMNYIKGFRYQMYCQAREHRLRRCTVSTMRSLRCLEKCYNHATPPYRYSSLRSQKIAESGMSRARGRVTVTAQQRMSSFGSTIITWIRLA